MSVGVNAISVEGLGVTRTSVGIKLSVRVCVCRRRPRGYNT